MSSGSEATSSATGPGAGVADPPIPICLLAISVFSLNALFRRRWKALGIFLATLVVAFLPVFGVTGSADWLYAEGFRVDASPLDDYLSGCKLIEFIEKGIKQTVRQCESHGLSGGYAAVYTTGELQLLASQRTSEWKAAMRHFSRHAVLIGKDGPARKLFGSSYEIVISSGEFDGDDERY